MTVKSKEQAAQQRQENIRERITSLILDMPKNSAETDEQAQKRADILQRINLKRNEQKQQTLDQDKEFLCSPSENAGFARGDSMGRRSHQRK